jgi:hypothetical protein
MSIIYEFCLIIIPSQNINRVKHKKYIKRSEIPKFKKDNFNSLK